MDRARTNLQVFIDESDITPDSSNSVSDERLMEKEFGILDRLTKLGIIQKYQEFGEKRAHVAKFYLRPPGGESRCDVIRLRSVVNAIMRE